MSSALTFNTPADIHDFPVGSAQDLAVCSQWNTNMMGFTWQAILGNPWNLLYASNQVDYFDTAVTPIPPGSTAVIITWHAFPNRLKQYLGQGASPANPYNYTNQQLLEIADQYAPPPALVLPFEKIPKVLCPQVNWQQPEQEREMYGPYGPRGWQDEYCEWCVVRDASTQKITRIDFTCENPEYWNTLWMVDPQKVADLYTSTLNWDAPAGTHILVDVEHLYLRDPTTGQTVIDPSTGRPAYNPLNTWNNGPLATRPTDGNPLGHSGGAMHLTATPNTLQTEMQLAGGATIQRVSGNSQAQTLICCAQYGQEYRNSDPHIGQSVNQVVSLPSRVALANPSGLYIQVPDLSTFTLPADPNLPPGATAQDCWQIVRGEETLIDPITGLAYGVPSGPGGNFVLHAVFQIPSAWVAAGVTFTVGDILDSSSQPIQWGGQVVQMMDIGLWARPIPLAETPAAQACVLPPSNGVQPPPGSPTPPDYAQPLQLFHAAVWDAYYRIEPPNPMKTPLPLASNSTLIAPLITPGQICEMALICTARLGPNGELPAVNFGPDIQAVVGALDSTIYYAVPGNSYPAQSSMLSIQVTVSPGAALGLRGVQVTNFGDVPQAAMPAMLNVVAAI